MVTKNQQHALSLETNHAIPQEDLLFSRPGDDIIEGGDGREVVGLSGRLSQYRFTATTGGVWITDLVQGRDGTDFVSNVGTASFIDTTIALPSARSGAPTPPRPVNDVVRVDADGKRLERNAAHLIAARQLLANDLDWQGEGLRIDALSDIVGGSAELTEAGDVLFVPDRTSGRTRRRPHAEPATPRAGTQPQSCLARQYTRRAAR